MRIAISFKLIIITVLLLLAATLPIAFQTSKYFEKTSRQREENINLDLVGARATEVEGILTTTLDKARHYAAIFLKMNADPNFKSDDFTMGFLQDKHFLALELYKVEGTHTELLKKFVKENDIKEIYKVEASSLDQARKLQNFSLESVAKGAVEIQNASFKGGPALLTIGFPLVTDQGHMTHLAVAVIDLALLQKAFSDVRERAFFLLDRKGIVIAHSDEQHALDREDFSNLEAVKIADESKVPRGQKLLNDPEKKQKNYVAYAKTNFGLTVFAEISEDVILEPAREVKRRTLFIAGIVLSVSLFLIFVFSLTLTAPLESLAGLIESVAKGNFNVKASAKVRTWFRDEVSELAIAFDHMIDGLKERDKVKTLFSKFHGSSITADLLKGEATLGGQTKDVIVFFSDIRGFTSFSEKRLPEEVVEMLNEYFAVMVGIINRHGGVVDKFIGDAIMAVWGAPISSENDAANAVTACLEMRKALADLNDRRISRDDPTITIGMGLHAGPVISGTIGSNERMEYTVIGNTVNTASRIEASTKAFGTDLLLSSDVFSRIDEQFGTEYAGAAEVKGRSEALKLYKVRGPRLASGEIQDIVTAYSSFETSEVDKVKLSSETEASPDEIKIGLEEH